MKKITLFLISCVLMILQLSSKEYKVEGFVFDYEDGWSETKSNDPNSVLKLEKSNSNIEFIKLESELSDFYLSSKLNEQRESLINRGVKPSDVKTQTIHYVAKIYYFTYEEKGINIIGLFTYNGISYSFISSGISEESFKKMMFGFRKEGEKIEAYLPKPKPKPKPLAKSQRTKKVEEYQNIAGYVELNESTSQVVSSSFNFSISQSTSVKLESSTQTYESKKIISMAEEEIEVKESKVEKKESIISLMDNLLSKTPQKPFIERRPLNKYFMLVLVAAYFIIVFLLKIKFNSYTNAKIKPYPKDMPPDFLFPFIITRVNSLTETLYQIITRNNQFLSGHINHEYRKFLIPGIYSIIYIHIIWSLGEFVRNDFFQSIIMLFPLGSYLISFIELPFVLLIIYSLILKLKETQKLSILDSQTNILSQVQGNKKEFIVKDAKGRDVLKVKKTGNYFKRSWSLINEDNNVVATIKDDYPLIWIGSKIFGSKFLKARCYYSIYIEGNKRIGFLFLDPNSNNGYQIHYDYDYFRLLNPIPLVSVFVYIISVEREESILFI